MRQGEHLGDRLEGECKAGIAGREQRAVHRHHGDTEQLRRHLRQIGDVVGVGAALLLQAGAVGGSDGRFYGFG
jgi:hypothetical protein